MSVKAGLPPIARRNTRLILLGSLPGDASLARQQYYAHPTNQFWRLLGTVLGEELATLHYESRIVRLIKRQIGLWDVIASASRSGSLDSAIRDAQHNRIQQLFADYPNLRAIAFNGSSAASIGRKLIGQPPLTICMIDLPSSSAANTKSFAEKVAQWSALGPFVGR